MAREFTCKSPFNNWETNRRLDTCGGTVCDSLAFNILDSMLHEKAPSTHDSGRMAVGPADAVSGAWWWDRISGFVFLQDDKTE